VPLQALVNKSDRLAPSELARVLSHVTDGLASLGLRSLAPVAALSARLALAGRLGDADAYARSGWDEVEQLLSSDVVNRSEELRARAVQRRAQGIARDLIAVGADAAAHDAPTSQREDRAHASRMALLDDEACGRILGELTPAVQQLEEDLRPVRLGSIPGDDPQARAYAEARVVARLTEPIAKALRASDLEPIAMVLRGAAAADPYAPVTAHVVRACAAAVAEVLSRRSEHRVEADEDAVRAARLGAMVEALG
jgi:hypothetical protein